MSQFDTIPRVESPCWDGPIQGGVTQSILNRFSECPFRFYLWAVLGLKDPEPIDERLIWGDTLHVGLEHLIKGHSLEESIKIMVKYLYETYPSAPGTFEFTTANMLSIYPVDNLKSWGKINTEVDLKMDYSFLTKERIKPEHVAAVHKKLGLVSDVDLIHERLTKVHLRGKADMVSEDGKFLGDHKGKGRSAPDPAKTKKELKYDIQMNLYAHILGGIEHWLYDIIKIPEDQYRTPPKRVSETNKEWADRIFYSHRDITNGFPIAKVKQVWFNQTPIFHPKQENQQFMDYTINPMILKMIDYWEIVSSPNFDPNDPTMYGPLFFRGPIRFFDPSRTFKFECSFYKYLTGDRELEDLVKIENFYPELEDAEDSRKS